MRVLHVINSLSGSGGAEQGMVREIGLLSPDIEQTVVTLYPDDTLLPILQASGVDSSCLELDSSRSGINWLAGARRLGRVIADREPDVVHSSLTSANLVSHLATRRRRPTPVLSTFTLSGDPHLMTTLQPGAGTRRAAMLRRVAAMAARAPHVWFRALTVDSKLTNCAAMGVGRDRVFVLPRGVPSPEPAGVDRAQLDLPEDAPILLNVGRQTAQKGHVQLLEAFVSIRASVPAHLVILGREGDASDALDRAIDRFGVADHVTVIPYTDRPFDLYQNADVFVFSSLMEGLGTAVLEAMASGVPVVAYDIPPVREATGNGEYATLSTVGDPIALAESTIAVLGARTDDMTSRAREWVAETYSLPRIASRLEGCLRELAATGSLSV